MKDHLRNPYGIGFVGGRNNYALFVCGYHQKTPDNQKFLGLDPHVCFSEPKREDLQQPDDIKAIKAPISTSLSGKNLSELVYNTINADFADGPSLTPSQGDSVAIRSILSGAAAVAERLLPTSGTSISSSALPSTSASLSSAPTHAAGTGVKGKYKFPTPELLSQLHVEKLDEVDVKQLDPSLTIGFYFRNEEEFMAFVKQTKKNIELKVSRGITPLYTIEDVFHAASASASAMNLCGFAYDDDDDDVDTAAGGGGGGVKKQGGAEGDDDEYVFL